MQSLFPLRDFLYEAAQYCYTCPSVNTLPHHSYHLVASRKYSYYLPSCNTAPPVPSKSSVLPKKRCSAL